MALTDLTIKAAKLPVCGECKGKAPKHEADKCEECEGKVIKQVKLADSHGLYLLVNKSGKYWRYDYKMNGKRKTLSIGTYPAVALAGKKNKAGEFKKGARDLLVDIKRLIKEGIDPSLKKQADRQKSIAETKAVEVLQTADENTFEVVALKRHNTKEKNWSKGHAKTLLGRFNNHVFPYIGNIPVAQLNKSEVAEVIARIVSFGSIETAHRVSQLIRQVLEYACDLGLIELIPMGNAKNIIPVHKATPMAAITDPARLGELLRITEDYRGTFVVCKALKLLPLVTARSGEFRNAKWCEIDLDAALWTIPSAHRKLTLADKANPELSQLVPLSKQAVKALRELYEFTGHTGYVFFSGRSKYHIISENTLNDIYKKHGFKHTSHGWRSVFSTL